MFDLEESYHYQAYLQSIYEPEEKLFTSVPKKKDLPGWMLKCVDIYPIKHEEQNDDYLRKHGII